MAEIWVHAQSPQGKKYTGGSSRSSSISASDWTSWVRTAYTNVPSQYRNDDKLRKYLENARPGLTIEGGGSGHNASIGSLQLGGGWHIDTEASGLIKLT